MKLVDSHNEQMNKYKHSIGPYQQFKKSMHRWVLHLHIV